jgi:AcrR family transcriptional regulator
LRNARDGLFIMELTLVSRTRSENYDDKKNYILNVAASMFAEFGYMGCKMEDIAAKCDVSKSMIYHYFKRKEDVLFEIVREHVTALNKTIEDYLLDAAYSEPHQFFGHFIEKYLEKSTKARERHAVTIRDTRWLTHDQMTVQQDLERRNVDLVAKVLKRLDPGYTPREYKVYAFLLIGMINWIELWYRASGSMTRSELYDRIAALFLDGFDEKYRNNKKSNSSEVFARKRETALR